MESKVALKSFQVRYRRMGRRGMTCHDAVAGRVVWGQSTTEAAQGSLDYIGSYGITWDHWIAWQDDKQLSWSKATQGMWNIMEHVSKYFEGITPNQSMQSMLECAVSIEQILYVAANWHSQDEEETLQQAGQEAVRKPWKTEERHWTKQVLASPRITENHIIVAWGTRPWSTASAGECRRCAQKAIDSAIGQIPVVRHFHFQSTQLTISVTFDSFTL